MVQEQAVEITLTAEQRTAVEAALRRELSPRERERLEMVKAVALRHDMGAIMAWSGRSVPTIQRWLGRFLAGGVTATADAPRSGRAARADAGYLQALETAVETPPRGLGLGFDVGTSGRLSAYLAEATGVRIAPSWLRTLLGRRRFACGRPKHTLEHLQDPDEVAACEAELEAVGTPKGYPSGGGA